MTRRYYRMRAARRTSSERRAWTASAAHRTLRARGPPHHLATGSSTSTTCRRGARARAACAPRCPRASWPWSTSTRLRGRPRRRGTQISHAAARRARPASSCPQSVHRIVVAVAEPGHGRGISAATSSPSAPGATACARTSVLRGLHPMMGERLSSGGCATSRSSALPSAGGRLPVPRRGAREPQGRAAVRARRGARPDARARRRAAGSSSLPDLERMLVEALAAHPRVPGAAAAARAPALEPRAALRLAADRARAATSSGASSHRCAPRDRGPRHRDGAGPRPHARGGRRRGARRGAALLHRRPARGSVIERRRAADAAAAAARRERAADRARRAGAGSVHPTSSSDARAARDRAAGCPPASSSSTTSTSDGALVPVDRPAGHERRRHRRRADPQLHRALPGGHAPRGAARRPDARRSARSPSRSAGAIIAALDLAEELGVPVEWFALSAGAKIAMDSGTENMDWIAAVLRRIIEFTQARRRDQRRRDRHQRRRPAVLERRGDDADAHAAASW